MFWRRRDKRAGLPEDWREILDRRSAQWLLLDDTERDRLGELIDWLLTERRWEAARGLELTDEIRTTIAAHACLLILGLDERWYDEVGAIVVRDGSMAGRIGAGGIKGAVRQYAIDGEAQHGDGPVMVSWRAARREAANLRLGRDVVLHEFAHKLDMLDGTLDGTPSLPDQAALDRWVEVCNRHYDDVVRGRSGRLLRSYAATNATEFFSVATESFFTRSLEMAEEKPDLYEVFADYFRQDPAARHRRALAAAEAAEAAAAATARVTVAAGAGATASAARAAIIPHPTTPRIVVRFNRPQAAQVRAAQARAAAALPPQPATPPKPAAGAANPMDDRPTGAPAPPPAAATPQSTPDTRDATSHQRVGTPSPRPATATPQSAPPGEQHGE